MKKLALIVISTILYSQPLNILLNKIEKNNDLSMQTKQEAAGISYVITRYQLDMMQAKYLKDVLKNTAISDNTNRYNLIDPFSLNMSPFGNNNIKVYIDDYEINSMSSENSLFLFSNLSLDFVDHIEIYYFSSADKYFGEPTYVVIKLYSKDPKRDNGVNLFTSSSKLYNSESFSYGDYKSNPYYIYASRNQVTNSGIKVETKDVSKNSKTYHLFSKMKYGKNNFIFNSLIDKRDAFLGMSSNGEPDKSYMKNKQFLIGWDRKFDKIRINYTFNYQENLDDFAQEDKALFVKDDKSIYTMYTSGKNFTNYLKVAYNIIDDKNSKFSTGLLVKNEHNFDIDYQINGIHNFNGIRNQTKYTVYVDNQYQYLKNSILNTSLSYSIYDNDVVDNYYLINFKIGNTYLLDNANIFKFFYFHIENTPPNYLVNSIFQNSKLVPTITNSYVFKYKRKVDENNKFFITFITGDSKDQIVYKDNGLENQHDKITLNLIDLRWSKNYNYINNFVIEMFSMNVNNSQLKKQQQISILNTHRYYKFSFFENIIYKKVTTSHNNSGCDLDLGIKYNVNENFTISIKGESLLAQRYENEYMRVDVDTGKTLTPFYYPSTPKNVDFSVEYNF